jgi:hypothetical protein
VTAFTIVSNNIPGRALRGRVKAHMAAHFLNPPASGVPAPTVLALQEFVSWRDEFVAWMPTYWRMEWGNAGQPVAWDTRTWGRVAQGTVRVWKGGPTIGSEGAGGPVTRDTFVNWFRLAHKYGGGELTVVNIHFIPTIDLPKQPGADVSRGEVHRASVAGLAKFVAETTGPVVVCGDFNAHWGHGNLQPLRDVGLRLANNPGEWTHAKGKRQIDLVMYRDGTTRHASGVFPTLVDDDKDGQFDDDHRGVWVHFSLAAKPDPKEGDVKPYDLTTYDGRRVDWITRAALEDTAARLRYADGKLTLTQGSYNAGKVGASAGTHDGGGVVDLSAYDHERKVRELRRTGFAAWYRPAIKGLWPEHIHAVLIGNAKLSPSAARQVTAYLNGRNGLADNGADNGPRDFVKNRYTWTRGTPPKPKPPTAVESFQRDLAALLDKYQGRILKRRVGAHKMLHDIRARAAKGPQK